MSQTGSLEDILDWDTSSDIVIREGRAEKAENGGGSRAGLARGYREFFTDRWMEL